MSSGTDPHAPANTTGRALEESGHHTGGHDSLTARRLGQVEPPSPANEPASAQSLPDRTEKVWFENVSAGEDAQQVILSTFQESVHGKDIDLKARGTQWLGQIDGPSIQQVSQDRKAVLLEMKEGKGPKSDTNFDRGVYGAAYRLNDE